MQRALLTACAGSVTAVSWTAAQTRPAGADILVAPLDDAGFPNFGAYGSDFATPNADALIEIRAPYSRYDATLVCATCLGSLMTGQDAHLDGACFWEAEFLWFKLQEPKFRRMT